ncbi:hypothetical protein BG005_008436 [Podila minutissima]|nr:hypothetical protein BG005_008436 [Podila minutissima]
MYTFSYFFSWYHRVRTVLDVGCGPGTWTMEMANEFPDANITGIDMSPMFPTTIIPENCRFLQHNVQQPLPFPDNSFDFVYQRLLLAGLTPDDWKKVMSELERITKPGGWIELVEIDGVGGNNGPHMTKIWEWLNLAFAARGVDTTILSKPGLVAMMQEANMVNVSQEVLRLPTGNHGGKIGILLKENEQAFWSAITPAVIHTAGVDEDEFEDAVHEAETEMEVYKSYHIFYIAIGQKKDAASSMLQPQPQPQHHSHHDDAVAV